MTITTDGERIIGVTFNNIEHLIKSSFDKCIKYSQCKAKESNNVDKEKLRTEKNAQKLSQNVKPPTPEKTDTHPSNSVKYGIHGVSEESGITYSHDLGNPIPLPIYPSEEHYSATISLASANFHDSPAAKDSFLKIRNSNRDTIILHVPDVFRKKTLHEENPSTGEKPSDEQSTYVDDPLLIIPGPPVTQMTSNEDAPVTARVSSTELQPSS
ncbi:hypothetical protein POVCU2_0015730 [Plasmodium ovale curtisi]|uniref:Uncharacterized protein n=1 Tax=Plasmodium ovale curtisi TaxID=864141 RepID=A0A1A8XBS4_PLAOA|nr:hypothetical protein POVCU2_0015730 [Plasmodium ovale curtisi]SBT01759.1 hypothetical protein POVCU1_069310 [Plasmodium ovale curtisi]